MFILLLKKKAEGFMWLLLYREKQNHQLCDQHFVKFVSGHQSYHVYFDSHLDSLSTLNCVHVVLVLITGPNSTSLIVDGCAKRQTPSNHLILRIIVTKGDLKPLHPQKSVDSTPVF